MLAVEAERVKAGLARGAGCMHMEEGRGRQSVSWSAWREGAKRSPCIQGGEGPVYTGGVGGGEGGSSRGRWGG